MSKTLLMMRHAKSSWDVAGQKDFVRPLNKRGRQAASLMGQFMQEQNFQPDFILSSPAKRTRETLEKIKPFLSSNCHFSFIPGLYLASVRLLRVEIAAIPDSVSNLMILGHNPGIWDLSLFLWQQRSDMPSSDMPSSDMIARDRGLDQMPNQHPLTQKFPTSAIAHFKCDVRKWADLEENSCSLEGFYRPKYVNLQEAE